MKRLVIFLSLGSLFFSLPAPAASPDRLTAAAQSISVYPADVRQAAQTALSHPATLVQLGQIQAKSRAEFKQISDSLSPDLQKKLWQVVHYPRLLRSLAAAGSKGYNASLVSNYPKETKEAVKELEKKHFELISQSYEILQNALSQCATAIQDLPEPSKAAFKNVIVHSVVFQVLSQALELSKTDPASFKKNPQPLTQNAQKLSSLIGSAEPATPPKTIQGDNGDDPEAIAALSKANQEFKAQNDYQLNQTPYSKDATVVNVGYAPIGWTYPSFFGWPSWDPFPFF